MSVTVSTLLRDAQRQLQCTENPRLEAGLLMCHLLDWTSTRLITHSEQPLSAAQQQEFSELLQRRCAGEPSAYIVGERAFWTLNLSVTADTLIPRADTETLVEHALELISETTKPRVLDMGTGSGAIALCIKKERPDACVEASDFSAAALKVAQQNAAKHRIDIHAWHLGSWFDGLPADAPAYDLIVSNPPYIAEHDSHLQQLRYEPLSALTAGADGLDDIRQLISLAPKHLARHGQLALEHGYEQADAVAALFAQSNYHLQTQKRDLAGIIRVSAASPAETSYAPL